MVFSTPLFLFVYLSLTLLLYYAVPLKGRNLALLAVSLFFYAWGERIYVVIMVASTLIDYTHGMLVERCKARGNDRGARWAVASSVFFNLALLPMRMLSKTLSRVRKVFWNTMATFFRIVS